MGLSDWFSWLFGEATPMSNDDIADMLIRFVEGKGDDPWEFDDFTSCSQRPEIEPYRHEVAAMRETFPPIDRTRFCNEDGMRRIRVIASEIRDL